MDLSNNEQIAKNHRFDNGVHDLLSIDEAAKFLGKQKQSMYNDVHRGKCPHYYKVSGRLFWKRFELRKHLEQQYIAPLGERL